jgi:hypothetical protein
MVYRWADDAIDEDNTQRWLDEYYEFIENLDNEEFEKLFNKMIDE